MTDPDTTYDLRREAEAEARVQRLEQQLQNELYRRGEKIGDVA